MLIHLDPFVGRPKLRLEQVDDRRSFPGTGLLKERRDRLRTAHP
jgi:hypothetical protein